MKQTRKPTVLEVNPRQELQVAVTRILRQGRGAALLSSATAALIASGAVRAETTTGAADTGKEPALTEIVVSAQRRTQSLQDVPYNISAISGDSLRDAGVISINSLTEVVPGLMNVDQGPATRAGNSSFILRGLRTDAPGGGAAGTAYQNLTVSPVSTYFGETPVFFQVPMDDLERVEVLRGPQGTLYGSGAQAGTMRFIPKRPEFDKFSGEVTAEGSYTQYSPNANGGLHGVLNIPIAEHLALRVVAGEEHLGGFIDGVNRAVLDANGVPVPSIPGNLASGFVVGPVQRGTNSSDQYFARAALRWQPAEGTDLQLEYLHQNTAMADSQWGSAWSGGPFDTTYGAIPNSVVNTRAGCSHCSTEWISEPYSDGVDLVDLVATVDVGLGTFTSASSYYDNHNLTTFDQTGGYYGTANPPQQNASGIIPYFPYLNYPRIFSPMLSRDSTSSFIQEVRLVSTPGKLFDYVVGAYYQRQVAKLNLGQTIPGIIAYDNYTDQPNPTTYGDGIYYLNRQTTFTDEALFGELTWHATDAWQFTGGVRVFRQPFNSVISSKLPLCGAICAEDQVDPSGAEHFNTSTTYSSHVWKLNTSYDFSPTLKVYATFSEGFRHGGVSGLPSTGPFASPTNLLTFQPDLAKNYEIGIKGSLLDHRINYFADIYKVDLNNFQFDSLNLSQVTGAFNGKNATSQGLEFESQMAVTDRLNVSLGYAFTRAYIVDSFNILDYPPYALLPSLGGTGGLASLFGGPIAAGTDLPGVSRHVLNGSADYTMPATIAGAGASWRFHVDGAYRSAQNSNINPAAIYNFTIPSVFMANARVALETANRITYTLFARNLTNNPDISGGINDQMFNNPYRLRNVGRPRTIGLSVRYQF